jgi:hypothetical protein
VAVRIDIEFAHPLGAESRVDFRLAVGDLAKAERVYFGRSGFNAVIMGEPMSTAKVRAKLVEYGLQPTQVVSSLGEELAALADEAEAVGDTASPVGPAPRERFKAIGRGG